MTLWNITIASTGRNKKNGNPESLPVSSRDRIRWGLPVGQAAQIEALIANGKAWAIEPITQLHNFARRLGWAANGIESHMILLAPTTGMKMADLVKKDMAFRFCR